VLYTHQKLKKSKVWQDGILKITHLGNKAILYDDKGQCLENIFLKCLKVKPGDDLESDRYLITVEEVKVAGSIAIKQDVIKEAPELNPRRFISSGRSRGCQPAGLKRKFTGFRGPRQVPKKMIITENGESAVSLEAKKPGSIFVSPFYSTPPLFSTAGKKDINNMPTDPKNSVTYKNRETDGLHCSSVVSTPFFKNDSEMLCEENYFCSPVCSVNNSDSVLTNEAIKKDGLTSHCLGVSQNIRSKAQILALLKSVSTGTCKELNSGITEHLPQIQLQGSVNNPTKPKCIVEQEECAEVKSTDSLHHQHQSENTMRNKSQWAVYLSSQSSPVHSSTEDGNNTERKPKAQGDNTNLNLKDLLVQERIQFFETCAEQCKKYNEDKPVDDNDPSLDQEVKLEIPSFCKSNSLPVSCSSVESEGLLSESDIQKNNKIPVSQNDQMCVKESILMGENAQEINLCGTPEEKYDQPMSFLPESEQLQTESSTSNNSRLSDDFTNVLSKSNTDSGGPDSIPQPMSNVAQPLVEVTFNLNNFETNDTEEESQESNTISQDSDGWVKEAFTQNDSSLSVQKRYEDIHCKKVGSEYLSHLTSIGDKPTETFPIKETLLSQFCDKACIGVDTGAWKAGNIRKEIEEYNDTLSSFDSSLEETDDVYIENNENANKSIQKVRISYDIALPQNKSKGTSSNLHIPCLNIATNQTPENSPLSEQAKPQPFIMGSSLDKNDEQVLLSTANSNISIQQFNVNPNHSEECTTLDKSNIQVSNSLFYPLGKKHPISKDIEAYIPESEDLQRVEGETDGESKQYWNSPRNPSELSGLVNNISLLKSLSEHSTALEGLEILKKKNTTFKQQGTLQTYEPDSNPEVRKPLTSGVSQALPKLPHLNQDSQQIITENEVEPSAPLQCFQENEETAFLDVIPKQLERKTCDPKPVEFQGHPVKGSATSAVMVRGHSSQLECGQFPDSIEYENCTTDTCLSTPKSTSACMQIDFLQVTLPEQKISTVNPVSTFSLNSRDDDFVLEFSEESLKERTLPGDLYFLN
ncbi:hypothetical protein PANDA_015631, partial [Ailuropoda melanoleuca]